MIDFDKDRIIDSVTNNLNNDCCIATNKEKTFIKYASRLHELKNGELIEIPMEEYIEKIIMQGNYVYGMEQSRSYIIDEVTGETKFKAGRIFRMDIDTYEIEYIVTYEKELMEFIYIDEKKIFYIKMYSVITSLSHGVSQYTGELYRSDLDGKNECLIAKDLIYGYISGEYIYYLKENLGNSTNTNKSYKNYNISLMRMTTLGKNSTILYEIKNADRIYAKQGEWIYISTDSEIQRLKIDGSEKEVIGKYIAIRLNVWGEDIFYRGKCPINRFSMITRKSANFKTKKQETAYVPCSSGIIIVDGWLYFELTDKKGLYRMQTDRSIMEKVF